SSIHPDTIIRIDVNNYNVSEARSARANASLANDMSPSKECSDISPQRVFILSSTHKLPYKTFCYLNNERSGQNTRSSSKLEYEAEYSSLQAMHAHRTSCKVLCYSNLEKKSPTVNISWFICKAYLANYYYVTIFNKILGSKKVIAVC